jgi:hypothetical protein
LQDDDRITPPADSLRSLTIGSVAHLDTVNTRVRRDEPSPFGRRGPGPAYVIKPELAYPGGNCDMKGQYVQTGIVSVDGSGHIAENIGTSFATPLGSTVAANVFLELDTSSDEVVSPSLVKALLVHSAFMRNARLDPETMPYYGIGSTPDLHEIISCRRSWATVIFQAPLQARPQFGKRPFPMPACLVQPDAGLQCEVFMTLVYDPPLDRRFGIEYCRCNVNASLGTVTIDPETNRENYMREIPSVPKELCESYEKDLIKHGYKWSPLKLYHRKFSRGPWTKSWRLTLELLNRSEHSVDEQQDVTLIVTLRALKSSLPVYDEFVSEMARLGWGAQDLRIRSRQRVQP